MIRSRKPTLLSLLFLLAGLAFVFAYAVQAQGQEVTPTKEATGDASPERPTGLQASAEHDSVSLTWTASTDDTVTHYAVLRRDRNADASGVFHVIDNNAGPGLSYTDRSVSAEGSYVYRVKAVSPTGVSQWSSYARANTPAAPTPTPTPEPTPESTPEPMPEPTPDPEDLAPTGLTAALADAGGVSLSWSAPAQDAGTVTGYEILRAQGDEELATLVADTGSIDTSHTDAAATAAGDTYAYVVAALRGEEKSRQSNQAQVQVPHDPADLAPSGLSARVVSGDDGVIEGVALAWDAPAEDAASVTGYEILRAAGDGEMATLVADTGSTGTTHTDATATEAGESYAYRVRALRGQEESQPSDQAVAIIPKATLVEPEPPIAEEQNVETTGWVSNTAQTLGSTFISLGHRDKRHTQGFTTGAEPGGYSLGSVGVYVRDEDLESGETFTVHIYTANASGARDTLVHTLISPDSYADEAVNLFTAPADATLAANTNYLVVFEATGNDANDFKIGLTNSTSEDSGSATGWSIEDRRRFDNGTLDGVLVISVAAPVETTPVPTTWSLKPSGLGEGDSFRLLFIGTTSRDASSSDIDDYNTFIQNLVDTNGHDDIKAHSATFRVLGSTEAVEARDNTRTTGTGVPIYWLNGAKVADDYADFYDGSWDQEATGRRETGASVSIGTNWKIWTGSAEDGTEAMNPGGTESRALGNSAANNRAWVMQGSPNGSNSAHGPIESNTASRTTNRGLYGLSGVFTVDASLDPVNAAPVFTSGDTFTADENQTAVGTVIATDADAGDTVSYAITGGADMAHFEIDSSSGVLTFASAPDHESPTDDGTNNVYQVTVTATGGTGGRAMTATQDISVTVNDVDEPPSAPNAPNVSPVAGSTTSLSVTWTAPDNSGKPDIQSYDLQYRQGTSGGWTPGPQDETGLSATISGLAAGTEYQVQVRATNDEGDSDWSAEGTGSTNAPAAPTVASVVVTSTPSAAADAYGLDETIEVTVTFSAAVTVTGTPRIQLHIGGGDPEHLKWADYTSGTGNEALVLAYTVQAGDLDTNGIYIEANELELNGGTIQSSDGTDATLAYTQPGTQSGHKVDGVRPTPVLAATSDDGLSIIILFNEPLHMTTAPASAFTLAVDTGTAPAVSSATVSGNKVTLGLDSALTADQAVTVTYADATPGDDSAAVQDALGNDAANFTTGEGSVPAVGYGTGCFVADGCYLVSADWSLIPSGLGAGDRFRLIFRSSTTRNAQSTNIADYNSFIQDRAAAGHIDIRAHSATFRVLGSTADDDARDNTATTYTAADKGVAIYWLGGAKVAVDYEDFYDGSWSTADAGKDENGNDRPNPTVLTTPGTYTGSAADGTEYFSGGTSRALGASLVKVGQPLSSNNNSQSSNTGPFYGLSPVFRVEGQTTNTAPVFTSAAAFSADENQTAVGTVIATDADTNDVVTYAVTGGADQAHFEIDPTSGVLTFATEPDHENPTDDGMNNVYQVTVTATGGTGGRAMTATQDISVTVTDVDEPPAVASVDVTSTPTAAADTYGLDETIEVTVTFDQAVTVTGTPRIQLRIGGGGPEHLKWADYESGSGTAALVFAYTVQSGDMDDNGIYIEADELELNGGTIQSGTGITANLDYPLQGQQNDHKVDGSLTPTTTNNPPMFQQESTTREVEENSPAGTDVGLPVTATDDDGDTLTYTLEGTDAASFDIDTSTSQIQTIAGVTYDHEAKSSYSVTVKADDGNGGTDAIAVTIDVLDVDEPPSTPAAPTVTPVTGSSDSLDVSWSAPDNSGKPDIESYDLQYRQGTSGSWTDGPQDVTDPEAIITGLDADTEYQVRVRATNDEGDGDWSAAGTGSTNALPVLCLLPTGQLWIACLTAGMISGIAFGYDSSRSSGTLAPGSFDFGTTTYTVSHLSDNLGDINDPDDFTGVKITLQPALATADAGSLTLHIGDDTSLPFADASSSISADELVQTHMVSFRPPWAGRRAMPSWWASPRLTPARPRPSAALSSPPTRAPTTPMPWGAALNTTGDSIDVTVTFSDTVTVDATGGTPQLELDLGGTPRQAAYASGTGTEALVFTYNVVDKDEDTDGIAIGADKLDLNGGTLKGGRRQRPRRDADPRRRGRGRRAKGGRRAADASSAAEIQPERELSIFATFSESDLARPITLDISTLVPFVISDCALGDDQLRRGESRRP